MGARVTGYALVPDTSPSYFELCGLNRKMTSITGDIRDQSALERAITTCAPKVIFHLAAQSLVRRSYREPVSTFAVNVMGTVNLLEAARKTDSVRAIIVATSDKCYENRGSLWGYREDDPLGGRDPYSASKACAELVAGAYGRSFFEAPGRSIACATVRAGNVIGGGDWACDRLVPDTSAPSTEGIPCCCAIRTLSGRGSTSWSQSAVTLRWPSVFVSKARGGAGLGTSVPPKTRP